MAQNTTNRRTIPSLDPTSKKKYPIYHHPSTTSTSNNNHHPPPPDPTIPPHSTIQSISNNFSKLYTTHKMLSSTKSTNKKLTQPHPHPQPQPIPSNLHSSCTTLTKSKSQHAPKYSNPNVVKVKETILVKVQNFQEAPKSEKIKKEWDIKESIDDVKKPHSLRSKSYNEGFGDIKMQSLLSRSNNEGCGDIKLQSLGSRSYNEGCGDVKMHSLGSRSYNEGCGDIKMQSLGARSNNEGFGDVKMQSLGSRRCSEGCGDVKMQSLLRRKSFCSSKTELADFFVSCGVKVVAVDMPPFMQIHAVDCARKAHDSLEKFTARTLACTLKREFDEVYGPAWHCIVGTSFGSFVTHSVGGFMYFSMDQKLYVLLFKTTVQKAE